MREEILGIFPGWIDISAGSLKKVRLCKLLFTTNRLIIVPIRERLGTPGFMGGPEYIFSQANTQDRLKMKEKSPEKILKSMAENFEILYSNIAAVELKSILGARAAREIHIFTDNSNIPTFKFSIAIRLLYIGVFEEFLHTVFPTKVSIDRSVDRDLGVV